MNQSLSKTNSTSHNFWKLLRIYRLELRVQWNINIYRMIFYKFLSFAIFPISSRHCFRIHHFGFVYSSWSIEATIDAAEVFWYCNLPKLPFRHRLRNSPKLISWSPAVSCHLVFQALNLVCWAFWNLGDAEVSAMDLSLPSSRKRFLASHIGGKNKKLMFRTCLFVIGSSD